MARPLPWPAKMNLESGNIYVAAHRPPVYLPRFSRGALDTSTYVAAYPPPAAVRPCLELLTSCRCHGLYNSILSRGGSTFRNMWSIWFDRSVVIVSSSLLVLPYMPYSNVTRRTIVQTEQRAQPWTEGDIFVHLLLVR